MWLDGTVPRPTIYDVARNAGVAASTVSRAFGVPGRVSVATRERVLAAAVEVGYEPRPQARALQQARHGSVAMVCSDITNPHFFELIRGAEQRARASGLRLVVANAEESPRVEREQVEGLASMVDGFVLASSRLPDQDLRDLATQHRIVLLNRELPGLTSVTLDTASGCRQILEHLAAMGHQDFTYCAGPPESWMGAARWAALSQGAAAHGLTARRVGPYSPTVAAGGAAADNALRRPATAVVAHNDLLAIGVLRRLHDRGIRVPEDVSVVGFDNMFAADFVRLSTLGGRARDAGRLTVELLQGLLLQRPGRAVTEPDRARLPTELVLRGSSGPVASATGRF